MKSVALVASSLLLSVLLAGSHPSESFAQELTVYASGLISPIGLTVDDQGRLWVGEEGTGNNDSRVSVITTDGQVHPFLTGLPSEIVEGDPFGAEHVYFDANGKLLIAQGEGSHFLSESILMIDPAGFDPANDTARGIDDLLSIHKIGSFSLSQDAVTTNPYAIAIGPGEDLYIVDAGLNGIVKLERCTSTLSLFATFDPIANPTAAGPPFMDAVPTGIVFNGSKFYVGLFVGFPFLPDSSRIMEVDLQGNVALVKTGLTSVVDLAIDPDDGGLAFIQFARWQFPFAPNSGGVFKLNNGSVDTVATGLNFPTGLTFNASGELFVSSFADGQILKIATVTSVAQPTPLPGAYTLQQNYPNPFNPETRIKYELPQSGRVVLKILNLRGQEVRTLVSEHQPGGSFEVVWDGRNDAGNPAPSGTYLYQIKSEGLVSTKKMVLLR